MGPKPTFQSDWQEYRLKGLMSHGTYNWSNEFTSAQAEKTSAAKAYEYQARTWGGGIDEPIVDNWYYIHLWKGQLLSL